MTVNNIAKAKEMYKNYKMKPILQRKYGFCPLSLEELRFIKTFLPEAQIDTPFYVGLRAILELSPAQLKELNELREKTRLLHEELEITNP